MLGSLSALHAFVLTLFPHLLLSIPIFEFPFKSLRVPLSKEQVQPSFTAPALLSLCHFLVCPREQAMSFSCLLFRFFLDECLYFDSFINVIY